MSLQTPSPVDQVTNTDFWRRTPPALFPALIGLMGLGLAWRAAADFAPIGVSPFASYIILGFGSVLLVFIVACYLTKIGARPTVIIEDMASVPGRAGVSALTVSLFLFSAAIAPVSPLVAAFALFPGLLGHIATAGLAILIMMRTPQGLIVSPAWHLSFVGFIVACLAAVPLGYTGLGQTILTITIIVAVCIYGISLLQMSKGDLPEQVRPLLAIHLAPVSLFTTVSTLLGHTTLALVFAVGAMGIAGVLISRARYLTIAGFSPLWGAFTFPIAAFSAAFFTLSAQISAFGWLALIPLALGTVLTPFILFRVLKMWSTGALATKTGAAVA
ncbi:tellurium resistance protein [Planktotalea sp.]|uniref:SLAC1 family transporter n=1 Tax=Planktotalea sp. TaxID=2029877 RepID=UPI0025F85E7B|nr:tellurium resistance protein [Planktotalea sp.]